MTVEATLPARERVGFAATEIGRQTSRRDSLEAVGLLLGILVILLVVTLVVGASPQGA